MAIASGLSQNDLLVSIGCRIGVSRAACDSAVPVFGSLYSEISSVFAEVCDGVKLICVAQLIYSSPWLSAKSFASVELGLRG